MEMDRFDYSTNCTSATFNLTSQIVPENNLHGMPIRTHESDKIDPNSSQINCIGTRVNKRVIRKAGAYILSPNFRSPIVSGIYQYLCKKENTNDFYTIKILPLKPANEMHTYSDLIAREILHSEYSLLSMLYDVEGVVKVYEIFKDYVLEEKQNDQNLVYSGKVVKRICMVLDCYTPPEYMNEVVNLQHYVIQRKRLPEKQAITIFHNILHVVHELHNRNIVHRDLKLGNFIYHRLTHQVTVFNFGLGKHLSTENFLLTDQKGSPAYISPDVISGKPYMGKPSDMWALGVLLYAMLYGQFPFHDTKSETLFDKIRAGDYMIPFGENVSFRTIQLIKGLLLLDPAERFTTKRALEQVSLIAIELRGPSRDKSLQIVPDITFKQKDEEGRNHDKSEYLHKETEEVVKMNFYSGKQSETTLRQVGSQIPVKKIGQDARAITPSEMAYFTQLLQRIPEQPVSMTTLGDEQHEVPEFLPNTRSQPYPATSRRLVQQLHSTLGPMRTRGRSRVDPRRARERERPVDPRRAREWERPVDPRRARERERPVDPRRARERERPVGNSELPYIPFA